MNEFKETISEEELHSFTNRIMVLSKEKIDELWFTCNFILSGHEKDGLKALRANDIENIHSNYQSARTTVSYLLRETKKADVEKNLKKLEEQ